MAQSLEECLRRAALGSRNVTRRARRGGNQGRSTAPPGQPPFLTKDAGSPEIAAALEAAKRGESAIDPAVQHHLVKARERHRSSGPHPTRHSCPMVSRLAKQRSWR
jgi:DNA-binding NarL/FixJ family response regulator